MRALLVVVLISACASPKPADAPDDAGAPRCAASDTLITCTHHTTMLEAALLQRRVHWQVPVGEAPDAGWPATLLFQGSFYSAARSWSGTPSDDFGGFYQAQVVQTLLEDGFAVLAPEAKFDGNTYWDTNIIPYTTAWSTSTDHALMLAIFDALDAGTFGPIDQAKLFATGISSGGYMTSRMADAYPGRFRALAIQSASWESCAGPVCVLPPQLPPDHPPTLFLHGALDAIVPISTALAYQAQLDAEGHVTRFVTDADAGHQWLSVSAPEIRAFFRSHE